MARLSLVQTSSRGVAQSINSVLSRITNLYSNLDAIRQVYKADNIANVVVDGSLPLQMDNARGRSGITLEFRYVLLVSCLGILIHGL